LVPVRTGLTVQGGAVHDVVVDPVLDVRRSICRPEESLQVRFVFGEQKLGTTVALEQTLSEFVMLKFNRPVHLS